MNHKAILVAIAALALGGCGSASDSSAGGAQAELSELLIDDSMVGADATCMRGKTAELSADDARFLIDNIDATDTAGFSDELQAWAESLLECIDLDEQLAPDSGQADDPVTSESTDSGIDLASVSKSGFATWVADYDKTTRASAAALIVNNSDEVDLFGTEVTFNVIGADGTPVATESTYVDVLPAGGSFPTTVDIYTDLTAAMPVTLEITAFADSDSFYKPDWVEMELGPTTINPDEYFSTVSGTVTNPGNESFDFYRVTCLILNDEGTVVGGASTYPDRIAPGQTIAWDAGIEDGPIAAGGVTAECQSIATIS
jgi:hypothetical protein